MSGTSRLHPDLAFFLIASAYTARLASALPSMEKRSAVRLAPSLGPELITLDYDELRRARLVRLEKDGSRTVVWTGETPKAGWSFSEMAEHVRQLCPPEEPRLPFVSVVKRKPLARLSNPTWSWPRDWPGVTLHDDGCPPIDTRHMVWEFLAVKDAPDERPPAITPTETMEPPLKFSSAPGERDQYALGQAPGEAEAFSAYLRAMAEPK